MSPHFRFHCHRVFVCRLIPIFSSIRFSDDGGTVDGDDDQIKCYTFKFLRLFSSHSCRRHLPFSKLSAESNSTSTAITNPDSIFYDNDDFNEGIELFQLINELAAPQSPLDAKRPACPATLVNAPLLDIISSCWREVAEYRPTAAQVSRLLKQVPGYQTGNVMQNLVKRLERYSRNLQVLVDERTELLENEMNKSETLLLELLPRSVMMELKSGRGVEPETFEMVSLYFSDLVSFTVLSARSTPMETVQMLNSLFTLFDSTIAPLDVYKVETIGDAYMVASGVPLRNGHNHCAQIAVTALRLRDALQKQYTIPHLPGETLKIRIGLHCGPCVAGVVGLNMPRYCLFGDTVIMAQHMESTGLAMRIQTSSEFYVTLNTHLAHKFQFQRRHRMSVSDIQLNAVNKDHQQRLNDLTYWLVSENTSVVVKPNISSAPAPVGLPVLLGK